MRYPGLWLDDWRTGPAGWAVARTAQQAIALLKAHEFDAVSLDHDLGPAARCGTGGHVLRWLLRRAQAGEAVPAVVQIHTRNPRAHPGMVRMLRALNEARAANGEVIA